MKNKIIGFFVVMLVITTTIPIGLAECAYIKNIEINKNINRFATDNNVEIIIYGTLWMMKNKPGGQTLGLYGTFENKGLTQLNVFFGIHIKTYSTLPWNHTIISEKNYTLPPGYFTGMTVSTDFGNGLFKSTFFLKGTGENEGYYVEKTARGICLGEYAFIIFH